ncbi:MAG TPA: hypothetical protein VF322_03150 [Gammaproteobacteria bacterium]
MSIRSTLSLAAALAALACPAVHAQSNGGSAERKPVPRTADGKPDLSGIWIPQSALLLAEGEEAIAAARAQDAAAGREPLPPNEPPPYKPDAEAQRQRYLAREGIDDPMARCLLTGVPRIMFRPLPFEIVQLPDRTLILFEIHHAFRIIPTDGRGHPDDLEPTYLGDSVGHWEGDTFVVDVTGFNTKTWLQGVGTIHSEQLHVTERYTRDTYNTITYEAIMEDPVVFTKPWRLHETFRLRPNERLLEYECIESNEDIVRFERLLEEGDASFLQQNQN